MGTNIPYPDQTPRGSELTTEHNLHDHLTISLLCLGGVCLGKWWNHLDLTSPYWRLYLNKRDGARIRVGREWLPLRAGHLYLIPAWVNYTTASDAAVEHIYVHFDLAGPPAPVLRDLFPQPLMLATAAARTTRLITIGDRLASGERPGPDMILAARGVVDDCLAEAVQQLPPAQRARLTEEALHGGPLGRVLAHVAVSPGAACSNATLARIAGCSTDHLIRLFRRHLGMPPTRYVNERRLASAARALAFGDEDLEAIATRCGFANRFSFSRAFAQQFGMPPARWRRRGG